MKLLQTISRVRSKVLLFFSLFFLFTINSFSQIAVSFVDVTGELIINASNSSADENNITLNLVDGTDVEVLYNGTAVGTIVGLEAADVKILTITGSEKVDNINIGVANSRSFPFLGQITIDSGGGDDIITGSDLPDLITSASGNNSVDARRGSDQITTGSGDDTINGQAGDDTINGGDGANYIHGGTGNDEITVGGGSVNPSTPYLNNLFGDDGNNVGTPSASQSGFPGNDVIYGGPEGDFIAGEDGDDIIYGNEGNDMLLGDDGDDYLEGDAGDDIILAGLGDDEVKGNDGNDRVVGDSGDDTIEGNDGDDDLNGNYNDDLIWGGSGDDIIRGGTENDELWGNDGNDILYGEDGNDILHLNNGGGELRGGEMNDILDFPDTYNAITNGGDGDDTFILIGGSANPMHTTLESAIILIDSSGVDKLDFSQYTSGVTIDVNQINSEQVISNNATTFILQTEFEYFVGSSFDDMVTVALSESSEKNLDGGPRSVGDKLSVDLLGGIGNDLGNRLVFEDYMDIWYSNFEAFEYVNTPDDINSTKVDFDKTTGELEIEITSQEGGTIILGINENGNVQLNGIDILITTYESVKASDVTSLVISGTDGNNNIDISVVNAENFPNLTQPGAIVIDAKGRNDILNFGDGLSVAVDGGEGDDTFNFEPDTTGLLKKANGSVVIALSDEDGFETINFSQYLSGVTIALNQLNSEQVISDNGTILILQTDIENFIGSPYDDIITVAPLENSERNLDGGSHVTGDKLTVDALGNGLEDQGGRIVFNNYMDITYQGFEDIIFQNVTGIQNGDDTIPRKYQLSQNYPNPFNPATTIQYDLPYESNVRLQVFNMLGEKVADLITGETKSAGTYTITWNAENYASGLYLLKVDIKSRTNNERYRFTRKMLLLK